MKRIIYLLIFLTVVLSLSKTVASEPANSKVRDSIFQQAALIDEDSLRSQYLRTVFQQYIGQESAIEYLDSALAISIRKKLHTEELWNLFCYCLQYEYRSELPKLEHELARLKEASYRYKDYSFYYTMWLSALQARCAQGDTEYAIIQAKEMKIESIRLQYIGGTFIASLALAQAYDFSGRSKEAIATYLLALKENPQANDASLNIIYSNLAKIYQKLTMYPQALDALQHQLNAVKRASLNNPSAESFKAIFLEIEIAFCKIYMEEKEEENLNKHLKQAGKFYDKNTNLINYIDYHALWGCYYKLTEEWDKCFHEFNLALSSCRGIDPFSENKVLKMQAGALGEAGYHEDAAKAYRLAAIRGDSLNGDMLRRHEEAHQANYKIRKALLEKERLVSRYRYIQVGAASLILAILVFAVARAYRMRRQMQDAEKETRRAFETIRAADKMKERFLHNITYEIRIPLNTVVGFAELLSSENELPEENLAEYSEIVKYSASKLLSLINNILDLSRLEAGMMRFNIQENDIVQLCREAKMMMEMETPKTVELTFNTELESLDYQIDSKWFLKLLTTLFTVPKNASKEIHKMEYALSKEDGTIKITIINSPIYLCWEDEQEQHILHEINRLYVNTLKGRYEVTKEEDKAIVTILLPVS